MLEIRAEAMNEVKQETQDNTVRCYTTIPLCAANEQWIAVRQFVRVRTQMRFLIPAGCVGLILSEPKLAIRGRCAITEILPPGFQEVPLCLVTNWSDYVWQLYPGDQVAQLLILNADPVRCLMVDKLLGK